MIGTRGLLKRIGSLLTDCRGTAVAEAAFVVPLLVTLLMGGIEAGRYILLEQKITRLASNTGDLVAREENVTAADVDQIFTAVGFIVKPFTIDNKGLIFVSSVTRAVGSATPTIDWQYSGAGTASKTSQIGAAGGNATLPATFTMAEGDTVIIAESFYDYEPFFVFSVFINPREIYHQAFYRPRFGAP